VRISGVVLMSVGVVRKAADRRNFGRKSNMTVRPFKGTAMRRRTKRRPHCAKEIVMIATSGSPPEGSLWEPA